MSEGLSPQSFSALSAASAWSPICDRPGMRPISVVSAAPTMAIDFGFIGLSLRRAEQREGDFVVDLLEGDLERHVEDQRLGGLRALDDVAHHARAFIELDHGDRVWRGEARDRPVMDHIAVEPALAARLEHADLARRAMRAERARREIGLLAGIAALQAQFARARPLPEMHRLGRRVWKRALSVGHPLLLPDCTTQSLTRAPGCGKQNLCCTAQERIAMITSSYVRTMAAYNAEMNRRLYDAAGHLDDAERRAPRGAFWGSIHGTLVHILWGDSQWMSRFDNWPRPAMPIKQSDHFIEEFAELCAARNKADTDISRWAEAVDDAWLGDDLVWFSGAAGREIRATKGLLVTHFFNHQTHHRGQAHAMLTAAGETTEDTCLFLVVPEVIA